MKWLKCDFWSHSVYGETSSILMPYLQCCAQREERERGSSQNNKMIISIPRHILPSPPMTRSLCSNTPSSSHYLPSASSNLLLPSLTSASLWSPSVFSSLPNLSILSYHTGCLSRSYSIPTPLFHLCQ